MQSMTIFLDSFAQDKQEEINIKTRCGNLEPFYLDPHTYYAAKETPWTSTFIVEREDEFPAAFGLLNNNDVESLTMSIDLFISLKFETDVIDNNGDPITTASGEPVTTFNEVVG